MPDSDDSESKTWSVDDLITTRVAGVVDKGLITNVVITIGFIDDDGSPSALTLHDDDTPFWTLEGLLRSSLRDVVAVTEESTRRRASGFIDSFYDE